MHFAPISQSRCINELSTAFYCVIARAQPVAIRSPSRDWCRLSSLPNFSLSLRGAILKDRDVAISPILVSRRETGDHDGHAVNDIVTNSLPTSSGSERFPRQASWDAFLGMTMCGGGVSAPGTRFQGNGLPRHRSGDLLLAMTHDVRCEAVTFLFAVTHKGNMFSPRQPSK